ncbi:MAG: SIS domain-containing protein [Bacteroidales bacterium]|nr:SIS domain-containing protein [Bacteroidales bacterium]MDT8431449.1 SIS domain-containing protein [Bacteroidales bacterium]
MSISVKSIFQAEAAAVGSIPEDQAFEDIVALLFERIHQKGGKVIASGMGKAGQVANNIATTFSATGTPAIFLHPSEAQHGDLGVVRENDVLLVLSNSGKTREIQELVALTHQLHPKLPVVLITGNTEGDLVDKSVITLHTGNPQEVCPLGLTPTTSTTVMMVMGDALTVLLMQKIGFKASDYARRHHGGYLGEKLRNNENK